MNKLCQAIFGITFLLFSVMCPASLEASTQALTCDEFDSYAEKIRGLSNRGEKLSQLKHAEYAVSGAWAVDEQAGCYRWLADQYRDLGSYRAEALYLKAVEVAPDHPEVLEGIAQYYRNFRGTKGLFARAEAYYVRAEGAVEQALLEVEVLDQGTIDYLTGLREAIVRGRIELNKREGLGLVVPREPGRGFGLYLALEADDGDFPVSHNDLTTPALTLLGLDPSFETQQMIRPQNLRRQRARLRVRSGRQPYWDLAWSTVEGVDVIASQFLPVTFFDLEIEDFEIAIEDVGGRAPYGDILWRVELRHGTFDVLNLFREESDRINASVVLTRNFGRLKTDLEIVGSAASIDLLGGESDLDLLGAVNLRMVHFRPHEETAKRPIDPRGYEYTLGFVTRQREFGEAVELVQETIFAGIKLRELVRRTDVQILPNFFRNIVRGRQGENSSNLELNVILSHRLIDRVNDLDRRQAKQPLGIAQWAFSLRLFEDVAVSSTIDDFESRGYVAGTFVELFSGPANQSTVIFEANYEIRDYYHRNMEEEMIRFGLRLGI